MSIFGKIRDAIFGGAAQAAPAPSEPPPVAIELPRANPTLPSAPPPELTRAPPAPAAASPSPSGAKPQVDVAARLDAIADARADDIDWRKSIVDLMKVLDLDSSLKSRRELAKELGYTGDAQDSAKMNVWLHKQVMTKLAANGGIVPAELKH
jgi:hypothetical protein